MVIKIREGKCINKYKNYLIDWGNGKATYRTAIKDIKHSKNITDLIEVKDIIQIKRGLYDDYNFIFICSDEDIITAKESIEKYAYRILTHEQYEQNSYKIGE